MNSSTKMLTPLGWITLEETDGALTAIRLPMSKGGQVDVVGEATSGDKPTSVLLSAQRQLSEYFAGKRTEFDLPLAPTGTEFQHKVWKALCEVAYGDTCSYAAIARTIGQPTASRAVGAANGRNPIAIVVPCHRVIGAAGTLVGYAGGLDTKYWLLRHESAATRPRLPLFD